MLLPGAWTEVLPAAAIVEALDEDGCLDGLPFMPEMAQHCGKRFKVLFRAERTCTAPYESNHRRLADAIVLDGLRCDGRLHGGCQLGCMMIWKESWLRPLAGAGSEQGTSTAGDVLGLRVHRSDDASRYFCQATELVRATTPGPSPWSPAQYLRLLRVRTLSAWELATMAAGVLRRKLARTVRRWLRTDVRPDDLAIGRPPLGLQPGDMVIVRSRKEILATLRNGRHRGLAFSDPMFDYCGRTMKVVACVERVIDERTGTMRRFAPGTVLLEGAICDRYRGCARNMPIMWRDVWLDRCDDGTQDSTAHRG